MISFIDPQGMLIADDAEIVGGAAFGERGAALCFVRITFDGRIVDENGVPTEEARLVVAVNAEHMESFAEELARVAAEAVAATRTIGN